MERPVIGIPIGDPSGIGPETVVKALGNKMVYDICKPLVVGDIHVLKKIDGVLRSGLKLNKVDGPESATYEYGAVDVVQAGDLDISGHEYGKVQDASGKAAYCFIEKTAGLAVAGRICAIATAPINKEALKAANVDYIGHTEILAGLTGTNDPLTMFQVRNMRIFFLSRHVSLRKACDMITADRLGDYIVRCDLALQKLGLKNRKIAVAGLNPHNGEHGLFGDEETREIEPAVAAAQVKGIDATGPVPADSVFHLALQGRYDAILALYHDQGHIAAKTVDFERTISFTIGMPFLRTSVDHGTAFDIAGMGAAGSVSMEEAIRLAAQYGPMYRDDL